MNEQYLIELATLLETNFRPVVKDVCPVYPAMVGFTMTTQKGDTEFLIGCNTDNGNFAVDVLDVFGNDRRVTEFGFSGNLSPEDLAECFGEWLDTLNVRVEI
jgi:hypothetical protein